MVLPIKGIGMYPSLRRLTYVKGGLPFYLWLLTHLFVLDTRCCQNIFDYGKSSSVRLRTESIGISPLPGTLPAAHFCYGSIIVPCVCHRPPRVVIPLHSRYRVDRSLPREITAHLLSLACPLIAYNAGNVPDEWVFSCQSSQGVICPFKW